MRTDVRKKNVKINYTLCTVVRNVRMSTSTLQCYRSKECKNIGTNSKIYTIVRNVTMSAKTIHCVQLLDV